MPLNTEESDILYETNKEKIPTFIQLANSQKIVAPLETQPYKSNLVFTSYAHGDSFYLEELKTSLVPINEIFPFYDIEIKIGVEWLEDIKQAMEKCKAGIILLSPYYLASDFITRVELPKLLELAEEKKVRLFILYVGECFFERTKLKDFQFVNFPNRSLYEVKKDKRFRIYKKLGRSICDYLNI